jgi:carbonic anhydrase/acetyltransferase-like protein (isoleucine patch superfamily)
MPVYALGTLRPKIEASAWIADNAVVVGNVTLGRNSSIWWSAVVRGDNDLIEIGDNTNIQDGAVLHTDVGICMTLGSNITVGHLAMLHGCTIGNGSLIGIGATILNNAMIGKECLIGARALVPEGKVIPNRSLVLGSPGRIVRQLTDEDMAAMRTGNQHYIEHLQKYREELTKMKN